MTTLLLIALLILAPSTASAQTGLEPAFEAQATSGANPPTDRFQDFLDWAVSAAWYPPSCGAATMLSARGFVGIGVNAAHLAREFAPEVMRLVQIDRNRAVLAAVRPRASLFPQLRTSTISNRVRALQRLLAGFASIRFS